MSRINYDEQQIREALGDNPTEEQREELNNMAVMQGKIIDHVSELVTRTAVKSGVPIEMIPDFRDELLAQVGASMLSTSYCNMKNRGCEMMPIKKITDSINRMCK
jgi:hypothetical protein